MEAIRVIERNAMAAQKPQPGLVALMEYLQKKDVRKGICTRNFEYVFLFPLFYGGLLLKYCGMEDM